MKKGQTLDNKKYRILLLTVGLIILTAGIITAQFEKKENPTVNYQTQTIKDTDNLLSGKWDYMPGVQKNNTKLLVQPLDTSIVTQDGVVAQKNPPINLAGTHIENIKGDFAIVADVNLKDSSSATMQFYGNVPIIADEFRIERESIQVSVTKDSLIIKVWDGVSQNPSSVRDFKYETNSKRVMRLERKSNELIFFVNDEQIGSIKDPGIFKSGRLWIGLDAQDKTWELQHLEFDNSSFTLADASTIKIDKTNEQSLQSLAARKRKDFTIGTAVALGPLASDSDFAKAALSDFGGMTPENDMKMINIQPKKGVYSFQKADALVQIAEQNKMTVHGHTLVFGEANPLWFTQLPVATDEDKSVIEDIMKDHITTVVGHFGNKVNSWDVVNEPLADYDDFAAEGEPRQGRENGQIMRDHKWYQAMGDEYIIEALQAAHETNPNATLFINEFGLESDGERWDAFLQMMTELKPQLEERDIPVKQIGVGFQSHVYERDDRIDPEVLKNHMQQLANLGYVTQVSENDVYSGDGERIQGEQYSSVLRACLEQSNCVAYRVWILSDRYNFWKDEDGSIMPGIDGLYGIDMQPRTGYRAIKQYLLEQ